MNEPQKIRILVADSEELVRRGLVMLLSRRADFEVVGEAASAAEALEKTRELEPDLVMLDVRLPDGSGIEVCREIRSQNPGIRVLMLTSYSDDRAIIASIIAGASGYLLKQFRPQQIVEAVRKVGRGYTLLEPAIVQRVLERVCQGAEEEAGCPLTEEEQRILGLITQGKTNVEIATVVYLSEKSVQTYVNTILGKLEVTRRIQATAYLAQWRMRHIHR